MSRLFGDLELKGRYHNVPTDEEDHLMPQPKKSDSCSKILVGSLVTAVLGSAILYASSSMGAKVGQQEAFAKSSSSINYTFRRFGYPVLSYFDDTNESFMKYKFLETKAAVIEPYADMEFYVYGTTSSTFSFKVCSDTYGCQSGTWSDSSSTTVKFECKPYDSMTVTVTEYDSTGSAVNTQTDEVLCMYVRREIRNLLAEDRAKFITTSKRIEYYDDATGQSMFGGNYMSLSTLLKFHHFNSGQRDADHYHEGNGFTIQHVKYTNMFENSLQSVDPSVVMPYWDFTKDSEKGMTVEQAYIFDDTMYGKGVRPADISKGWRYSTDKITDARISSGLWKDTTASTNPYGKDWDFGYGYMRAGWSMNPSPYVSRFTMQFTADEFIFPNCSDHYAALAYDDLMDFYYELSYEPHGPIHQMNGGVYGCDLLDSLVESGYITDKNNVCDYWAFLLKENYRSGYISPKVNCTAAEVIEESNCGFTCSGSASDIYKNVYILMSDDIDTTKSDIEEVFYNFICDGGDGGRIFPGDHLESASPSDPSFWVIHPTLERLLQAKLLAGGFMTDSWATDSDDDGNDDFVCIKSSCYDQETDSFTTDGCCYGHYEYDQMFDGLAADLSLTGATNHDTQTATDATSESYAMSYIYDSFDWSHCNDVGLSFDELFKGMYLDMTTDSKVRRVPRPEKQELTIKKKAHTVAYNKEKLTWNKK